MSGGATSDPCVEDLRRWFERLGSGCGFAQHLARKVLIYYLVVPEPLTAAWVLAINAGLDEAASEKKTAIIVFPRVHTSNEIAESVRELTSDARWRARWVASESRDARRAGLLAVTWRTPSGDGRETSVMGLAPLRHMPLPRRAPYAAMVLWPAGRENPRASIPTSAGDPVGLVDAAHGLDDAQYEHHWSATISDVKKMLVQEQGNQKLLREIAFRLPLNVMERFFPTGLRHVR